MWTRKDVFQHYRKNQVMNKNETITQTEWTCSYRPVILWIIHRAFVLLYFLFEFLQRQICTCCYKLHINIWQMHFMFPWQAPDFKPNPNCSKALIVSFLFPTSALLCCTRCTTRVYLTCDEWYVEDRLMDVYHSCLCLQLYCHVCCCSFYCLIFILSLFILPLLVFSSF